MPKEIDNKIMGRCQEKSVKLKLIDFIDIV